LECFPDFADEISTDRWSDLPMVNVVTDEKCHVFAVKPTQNLTILCQGIEFAIESHSELPAGRQPFVPAHNLYRKTLFRPNRLSIIEK
jgi:hypothetical protein